MSRFSQTGKWVKSCSLNINKVSNGMRFKIPRNFTKSISYLIELYFDPLCYSCLE